LAGRIEIRGLGIRRIEFEPIAVVGLVVDLDAKDAGRLPEQPAANTEICGVRLPRLAVAAGMHALPLVLALRGTAPMGDCLAHGDWVTPHNPNDQKINHTGPRIAAAQTSTHRAPFGPVFPQCSRTPIYGSKPLQWGLRWA